MTDGGGTTDDVRRASDGSEESRSTGDRRDGPLGDLAAEVRERTGGRSTDERSRGPRREGPLADVASKVDERRRGGSDPFESVEVGDLDGERLWEQLAEGDDRPTVTVRPEEVAPAGDTVGDGRDVRTIHKDTCHGCPHFGDPPELACSHGGTEILAMPDADHFRVADCPMVGDDEAGLGELGTGSDDGGE